MSNIETNYLKASWRQRIVFILFVSKKFLLIFRSNNQQYQHLRLFKPVFTKKVSVSILCKVIHLMNLTPASVRFIWNNYSHSEIKKIFSVGSSPVISKQITKLKELAQGDGNSNELCCAMFILLSLRKRPSEIISSWLKLVLDFTNLTRTEVRLEISDISWDHISEVRQALTVISNNKLRKSLPSSYEVLVLILINCLSDIGKTLNISPNGLEIPDYDNLQDLAFKVSRRWHYAYAPEKAIIPPWWLAPFEGLKYNNLTVSLAHNSKDMYKWAIELENCIHISVDCAVNQKSFYLVLTENKKIKYLIQINEEGIIMEIKGKYNSSVHQDLRLNLQNFIYRSLKEII